MMMRGERSEIDGSWEGGLGWEERIVRGEGEGGGMMIMGGIVGIDGGGSEMEAEDFGRAGAMGGRGTVELWWDDGS
jgi:hypothetical protein